MEFTPGIVCLLLGWITCYLWLPNPLLFIGCFSLLIGRNRLAFVFGVMACLCTLPLLLGLERDFLSNLTWGYYVWQADIFLFTLSSGILLRLYGARVNPPRK